MERQMKVGRASRPPLWKRRSFLVTVGLCLFWLVSGITQDERGWGAGLVGGILLSAITFGVFALYDRGYVASTLSALAPRLPARPDKYEPRFGDIRIPCLACCSASSPSR